MSANKDVMTGDVSEAKEDLSVTLCSGGRSDALMMDTAWDMKPPPTRNKIIGLSGDPPLQKKSVILDFILVSSSRCPHLFYIQIPAKKNKKKNTVGAFINKTIGLQYSCDACHQGFPCLSSQSSWCADIWWVYFFGFLVFVLYYHITGSVFQELAEHFVPPGSHVKHARVKVWSSSPIMPGIPYYLFGMPECRQRLSSRSQSSRGHVLALKKIVFNAIQWKSERGGKDAVAP